MQRPGKSQNSKDEPLKSPMPTWAIASVASVFCALTAMPVLSVGTMDTSSIAASIALALALSVLSAIDFKTHRLPDLGTLPLIGLGLLLSYLLNWEPDVVYRTLAAVGAFIAFWLLDTAYFMLRQRTGLGLGDAKLFAAAGAWLGAGALPTVLLYASFSALLYAIGLQVASRSVRPETAIPFGPFLSIGIWLVWLYGPIAF